jgi:hypothetical protein
VNGEACSSCAEAYKVPKTENVKSFHVNCKTKRDNFHMLAIKVAPCVLVYEFLALSDGHDDS